MDETMIERVAKALIDADPTMNGHHMSHIAAKAKYARAAIAAMREPTLAMRKVSTFAAAEVDWPAMIDAALQETPHDHK